MNLQKPKQKWKSEYVIFFHYFCKIGKCLLDKWETEDHHKI